MESYYPGKIEAKWRNAWERLRLYEAEDFGEKSKKYILVEFPYPSGDGLHLGHAFTMTIADVLARKKRMDGFNVLFPMGWDAFGLPTENYAIKTGIHPTAATKKNTERFKEQMKGLGLSFDFKREVNTTDPGYYKWTQWIFTELFKAGLAYKAETSVGWCPSCKIILANEEIVNDRCERCGTLAEHRMQKQWILAITKYADRLVDELDLVDYPDYVKKSQRDWIGRSEGVHLKFRVKNAAQTITVFTTAIDTVFGTTFMVIAPEYAQKLLDLVPAGKKESVSKYIKDSLKRSELERQAGEKAKTGVDMGLLVINPFSGKEMPVFVADYILASYGTGAVMGVPGHDARDYEFAKRYNLAVIPVIEPFDEIKNKVKVLPDGFWDYPEVKEYAGQAVLINSAEFDGLTARDAKKKLEEELVRRGIGGKTVNYHLRDWIFSRQHYWGEPIPMIYCEKCAKEGRNWWDENGGPFLGKKSPDVKEVKVNFRGQSPSKIVNKFLRNDFEVSNQFRKEMAGWWPVSGEDLPLELPYVEGYKPTDTGESPLAKISDWVEVACPECGANARRETDTMPNWAGSSWYYLRYCDVRNNSVFADHKKLSYWMPVDVYLGGAEHTTLHLLYSRFWHKFLNDIGVVPESEPYAARRQHGVILGEDGQRMSKSRGNVINPDEMVKMFGADALRSYLLFMGPYDSTMPWDTKGLIGVYRFLEKVWRLRTETVEANGKRQLTNGEEDSGEIKRALNRTIKKVGEDIDSLKFNTAISAMMEFVNLALRKGIFVEALKKFLVVLSPFAPFMTEELWQKIGGFEEGKAFESIHSEAWPKVDEKMLIDEMVTIVVQVNGRTRDRLQVVNGKLRGEIEEMVKGSLNVTRHLEGKKVKNVIFVPGRLINFVVE